VSGPTGTWTNWAVSQACRPARIATPADEAEVAALVSAAARQGMPVRAVAAAHSFSPIVSTDGLLLDMSGLRGIRAIDRDRRRVVVAAGTPISDFGDPLWTQGLALANQGDIDTQQIGGAVATATHGSGLRFGSFSATVRRMRLVTAAGDVLEVGDEEPDLLHAAQVSIGMLGVVTELELEAEPAYRIGERIERWSWDDAWDRFDEMTRGHRHYSFFWIPAEESAALYGLADPGGASLAGSCYVKIYDEVEASIPDSGTPGRRVDRAHRIYPMEFEPNFHELEYFVPYERGREAAEAMRELMLASLPDAVFPLEIRTVGRDQAFLSHSFERDTLVLSVSGMPGTEYEPYLRAVDRLLGEFDARVHWGKLHYLTRPQLLARYPQAEAFIGVRRRLDPDGVFLNPHLAELFA
jgi:FAD/FMN-containing dehydrogenase